MEKHYLASVLIAGALLMPALPVAGQAASPSSWPVGVAQRTPYYVSPSALDLHMLLAPPPAQGSKTAQAELTELHRLQNERTAPQVAAAQADDKTEDMFLYARLFGPGFNGATLPLTAALSDRLRNDVGVVDPPLKKLFARPRPFVTDETLHPVCEAKREGSYPSGHAFNGFLYGFVLAEMVPERQAEILARAEDYAHNRMICGVHYQSDLQASRSAASITFGDMLTSARFQSDLAAAANELRQHLKLAPLAHTQLSPASK